MLNGTQSIILIDFVISDVMVLVGLNAAEVDGQNFPL